MPSNKRARSTSSIQKSKRSKASNRHTQTSIDITAQNAVDSPLLRLPAELRNRIWEFAYGDSMVNVWSQKSVPELDLPDIFHYNISRRGRIKGSERMIPPRFICKQFWSEASYIFLASATVELRSPEDFRALAISAPKWLQFLRMIAIVSSDIHVSGMLKRWAHALTSSLVGRFTHLEGVSFRLDIYSDEGLLSRPSIMTDTAWKKTKLPSIVRAMRQHKLKPELTSVVWKQWVGITHQDFPNPAVTREAIRTELLKYHPRRTSKRGKIDGVEHDQ